MKKYFLDDKNIEGALIKTCILFEKKEVHNKKDALFLKMITSLIMCGKANTVAEIADYLKTKSHNIEFDKSKIEATIKELVKKQFIEFKDDVLQLTSKTKNEITEYVKENTDQMDNLVERIFETVRKQYTSVIHNEAQVRLNIKDCLNYYFEVESLSFFDLDNSKNIRNFEQLNKIASSNLSESNKELTQAIVYAIGCMLQQPTQEDSKVLETLSKLAITSQIMGQDPLLSSFKATVLKNKSFILDTEVMLHLITNNTRYSEQYKLLVQKLLDCQCRLYVPEEVVYELYDHAEAASKRYHFRSNLMASDDPIVVDQLKNIFLEDFYYLIRSENGKGVSWSNYIRNYIDKSVGATLIYGQLHDLLDPRIKVAKLPDSQINENELHELSELSYRYTIASEKAVTRGDEKNWQVGNADALLYLTARYLNQQKTSNEKSSFSILGKNCYILSTNTRIHQCAKELGLAEQVLCKPNAILAYLAETGILSAEDIKISSLFDNLFLMSIANDVWPEIEKLLKVGFDFKGVSYVALKNDLGKVLDDLLTKDDSDDYSEEMKRIKELGYNFLPKIDSVVEENIENSKRIESLERELEELRNRLSEEQKKNEKRNKVQRLANYHKRVAKNKQKKN